MNTIDQKRNAAKRAIESAGGSTSLAKLLSDRLQQEISQTRVAKWQYNGVAPRFVVPVHEITGIPLHDLNPECYPKYIRTA